MRKIIGRYPNGNYTVVIFDDGTKIRFNHQDHLTPLYPESIDLKICNRCDMGCPMCHECSTPDGVCANLHAPVLDTLRPYTELAIGGGNPLEHPGLYEFLKRMKAQRVICNMTVHLRHFISGYGVLKSLASDGLIHGLGVSVPGALSDEEAAAIAGFPNTVVHVIAGVIRPGAIATMEDRGLRLLILGYKEFGRGSAYASGRQPVIARKIEHLKNRLPSMFSKFEAVSFDNLAIGQLDVQSLLDKKAWNEQYMGDDGQYTMYIDLVKREYAMSSTSPRHSFTAEPIEKLFAAVRKERENNMDQKRGEGEAS